MKQLRLSCFCAYCLFWASCARGFESNGRAFHLFSCALKIIALTYVFQNLFNIVIKTKRKEFIRFCRNLIISEKERHAKPLMNETILVSVSTEKDPGLIQIGSTLSSARAICRFLKNFQKQMFCAALRRPVWNRS